jgi:hypothetical protein
MKSIKKRRKRLGHVTVLVSLRVVATSFAISQRSIPSDIQKLFPATSILPNMCDT